MSSSGSLATEYDSLNNDPWMIRPTLSDLKIIELIYYSLMVSINKCNGRCNANYDLYTKMCVPSKKKDALK